MLMFGDGDYAAVRGSDIERDGMFLEIMDRDMRPVAEIFYSDGVGRMSLTTFRADLPVEVVEWMIDHARRLLPPADDRP